VYWKCGPPAPKGTEIILSTAIKTIIFQQVRHPRRRTSNQKASAKKTINKMKRQPINGKKYLQIKIANANQNHN